MTEAIDWRKRIVSDPAILGGKPAIKGTRVSVELILGCLAVDGSFEDLMEAYPHVTKTDICAALAFAAQMLGDVTVRSDDKDFAAAGPGVALSVEESKRFVASADTAFEPNAKLKNALARVGRR